MCPLVKLPLEFGLQARVPIRKDTIGVRREFTLNMISEWFLESANFTCGNYDRGVDELQLANFTPLPSIKVWSLFHPRAGTCDISPWVHHRLRMMSVIFKRPVSIQLRALHSFSLHSFPLRYRHSFPQFLQFSLQYHLQDFLATWYADVISV